MRKFAILAFLAIASMGHSQSTTDRLSDLFNKGTFDGSFRLGYEYSSVDNTLAPGQNLSIRTRFGYRTLEVNSTSLYIQMQSVHNLLEEHSFAGGGDKTRDVIGDVDGMRIHQAYVQTDLVPATTIFGGRKEIILDDARFIGNIGWRQFAQSFDGVHGVVKGDTTELNLAWVSQVNTINNTSLDLKNLGLINAKCTAVDAANMSLFGYLLDMETGTRDSITLGARVNGTVEIFDYDLTFAQQDDFANGSGHDAQMGNAYIGVKVGPVHVGAGFSEIDGADANDTAFDTLFSTAHKFNGWADQFASTNGGGLVAGLEDSYVDVKGEAFDTTILLRYHQFKTAESGPGAHSGEYGDEIDLMFKRDVKVAGNTLSVILQFALYNETNSSTGVNPTADEVLTSLRVLYKF
jgi:hypothetical protein